MQESGFCGITFFYFYKKIVKIIVTSSGGVQAEPIGRVAVYRCCISLM